MCVKESLKACLKTSKLSIHILHRPVSLSNAFLGALVGF